MKLVEALKKVNRLEKKAEDLRDKAKEYCAISNLQTPTYPDQKSQIDKWIQAHSDVLKEILRLRIAIQKTNIETLVDIELGDQSVTKSIAEWIHRRRDLADKEFKMWYGLTDRGIQEGVTKSPSGDEIQVKIVRFYDPGERDNRKESYYSEPFIIDGRLEVVNAVTDLIE